MIRASLLVGLLVLAGCDTRGSLYLAGLKPLPLLSTPTALVQVVPQTRRAVVVTPGQPVPAGVLISAGARYAATVPNSDLVAILAGTPKSPKLDVLDASNGDLTTLAVPGFFDTIQFSPDGRFGVLVYVASGGTGQLVARNLNELGLWTIGGGEVVRLQLDTESLAPRAISFGPAEPNRQLVAVSLERGVALFDALHPAVAPRRISIRPPGSGSESVVAEAVFSLDGHWLFLRASGLDDVIVVELGAEIGQPVSASINFVAGGRGLADIEAPPAEFPDSVLAVYSASKEAFLLDARGIQDRARRLVLTDAHDHLRTLTGSRVMLWDEGSRAVAAWDLADGRTGSIQLDGAFAAPMPVPSLDKALFAHNGAAGAGPALSTVTVTEDTNRLRLKLQSIQLLQPYSTATLDRAAQRLFFSVAQAGTLVTMDLRTLQLLEVPLDAPALRLHHLSSGDWLAVDHGGAYGDVTVMPAGSVERSTALRYSDFALTDELDRPGDAP